MIDIKTLYSLVDIEIATKIAESKLRDTTRQMYNEYWATIDAEKKNLELVGYTDIDLDLYEIANKLIPDIDNYKWVDTTCSLNLDGVEISVISHHNESKIIEISYEQILAYLQNQAQFNESI